MRYSVERIFRNLWRQKIAYFVILTEFALGIAVFTICTSYMMTTRTLLREYKESRTGKETHVECYVSEQTFEESSEPVTIDTKTEWDTRIAIDYDTYADIYEEYSEDMEILFSPCRVVKWFIFQGEDVSIPSLVVHYMNDEMFCYLYGFDREENCIYLGEKAYEVLLNAENTRKREGEESVVELSADSMRLDGDMILTADGQRRCFEVVHILDEGQEVIRKMIFSDEDDFGDEHTNMEDVLILPVEELQSIPKSTYDFSPLYVVNNLTLLYRDADSREDVIPEILLKLTEARPDYMFVADNAYLEFKQKIDSLEYNTYNWLLMSVSMILLSGIGCVGFLFLQMNKRRHTMAVSIAYGSTYRRVVTENLIEIGSIFAAGAITGVLLSPKFRGILLYRDELKQGVALYLFIGGIAVLFTLLSVGLGMHEVRRKDVGKSLREE